MFLDILRWFTIVSGSLILGFNIAIFSKVDINTQKFWSYKGVLLGRSMVLFAIICGAVGSLQHWTHITRILYNVLIPISLIISGISLIYIYKDYQDGKRNNHLDHNA